MEKFADISPRGLVRLVGYLDNDIKRTVNIMPDEKYPFEITDITTKNQNDFAFSLSDRRQENKGWTIVVENRHNQKGRYYGTLVVHTTSKVRPELDIRIFGDIREKPKGP